MESEAISNCSISRVSPKLYSRVLIGKDRQPWRNLSTLLAVLLWICCGYHPGGTVIGLAEVWVSHISVSHRDNKFGFQLYQSDPSGNFSGWKAAAAGANHQAASNILKTDYVDGCSLEEAIKLILHVMAKTMDSALSTDKVELATLTRDAASGSMRYTIYESEQLKPLLAAANEQKEAARP
jgi:hypothetical protein